MTGKKQLKIAVGMSGGVDSTMAAYILKNKGYEVVGITMRIWAGEGAAQESMRSGCYGPGEVYDTRIAQSVCERLGIPHHIVDLSQEYRSNVLDIFFAGIPWRPDPEPVCFMQSAGQIWRLAG